MQKGRDWEGVKTVEKPPPAALPAPQVLFCAPLPSPPPTRWAHRGWGDSFESDSRRAGRKPEGSWLKLEWRSRLRRDIHIPRDGQPLRTCFAPAERE